MGQWCAIRAYQKHWSTCIHPSICPSVHCSIHSIHSSILISSHFTPTAANIEFFEEDIPWQVSGNLAGVNATEVTDIDTSVMWHSCDEVVMWLSTLSDTGRENDCTVPSTEQEMISLLCNSDRPVTGIVWIPLMSVYGNVDIEEEDVRMTGRIMM